MGEPDENPRMTRLNAGRSIFGFEFSRLKDSRSEAQGSRDGKRVAARNRGKGRKQRRREGAKRNREGEGLVQILKFPIYLRVLASSLLERERSASLKRMAFGNSAAFPGRQPRKGERSWPAA